MGHYGMVIPRFVEQAMTGQDLTIFGDGKQSRCFCNVGDTVEALVRIADEGSCVGEIINIGSTEEISIEDLAAKVIEITGSESGMSYIAYEEAYADGFEDMRRRVPDTRRIEEHIGWGAKISLDETIEQVWKNMESER